MDVMGLIVIFAGVLFFAIIIFFVLQLAYARKQDKAEADNNIWLELSQSLGMMYDPKKRKLEGNYRGRRVILDEYQPLRSASGLLALSLGARMLDNPEPVLDMLHARIRINLAINNPANGYMSLVKAVNFIPFENLLSPKINSGVDVIDRQFQIESKPKEFVGDILRFQPLQDQFLDFQEDFQLNLVINKKKLHLQVEDMEISHESVRKAIDLACDFADHVDSRV